ncbi:MAG: ABC transporter substrate-binding protein [Pseudomonadota bacterium]
MTHGYWRLAGLVVCFLAGIAALWLNGTRTKDMPLRIGTNPWPGYEFFHLAEKKGFFKEEGVDVELVRFSSLEDTLHAFQRRQVDGMTSTLIELLLAYEAGEPAKIVLMIDFSNGTDVVIARKGIDGVSGLRGKKIAVESASLGVFIIARALEKNGLSLSDADIIGMNPANMEKALLSGEVDALHAYPPVSTNILKHKDKVAQIFDSSQIPQEVMDVLSFSPEVVEHKMEDMRAIRRAWGKTLVWAQEHPEEANRIMANVEGVSPEDFADALKGVRMLSLSGQRHFMEKTGICSKNILHVATILHKEGHLREPSPNPDLFLADMEESSP